ncbi:MAG: hypothetical protein NTY81_04000 [Candidatus Staskawiczbacteria bacterium]|nr:hypothetical protein [Candidatus Staskawiczbacteria bacterium]
MNKKIIFLVVFVDLFCLASFVSAQGLTNPLKYNDFSALLLGIAGAVGDLIAVLGGMMIVVAGILYLTSAGSPERMGTAKKALVYAIIGIAIGLAAKTIVGIIQGIIGVQAQPGASAALTYFKNFF